MKQSSSQCDSQYTLLHTHHTILATCHQPSPDQPSPVGPFDPSPLETKVFSKRIRTQNVIDPNRRRAVRGRARGRPRGRGRRQQKGATCNVPPAIRRTTCKLHCDLRQFVNLCFMLLPLLALPLPLCLCFFPSLATSASPSLPLHLLLTCHFSLLSLST